MQDGGFLPKDRLHKTSYTLAASGFDAESRNRMLVNEDNLATAQAELASLNSELKNYSPKAPFAGHLRDDGRWLVETWLDEESVQRVSVGDRALFITDGTGGPPWRPHSHA